MSLYICKSWEVGREVLVTLHIYYMKTVHKRAPVPDLTKCNSVEASTTYYSCMDQSSLAWIKQAIA